MDLSKQVNLVVCVGPEKTGTTWLFRCLQEHPRLVLPKQKEINYFSEKFEKISKDDYLALFFKEAKPEKIPVDISPGYFKYDTVPDRIKDSFPEAKVIIIVRDPIERAYSHYRHYVTLNKFPCRTLQEAIYHRPRILESSMYEKHLRHYMSVFKEEELIVLDYEELKKNPQKIMDEVCAFTGIKTFTPSALKQRYNTDRVRGSKLYFFISRLYIRLMRYPVFQSFMRLMNEFGLTGRNVEQAILRFKRKQNTQIPLKDRKYLESQLKDDIQFVSNYVH